MYKVDKVDSIEISTVSEINEDLHDAVGISLGTPVGGLNMYSLRPQRKF